ncbi:hypothetical protein PQS31_06250 [Luteimonas sp BLCC-B24]|uniref:hypothetical protein n=1 Tax=Luteimonas sp. BLCC-B24 TaxID=3025317 RepID=UPI00234D098C|nr:hypothetical protein [Luteimonas sp. BLCC-B24]MDC7806425.1 hypothetical protein [Luteimonas sp. BLCC-B24]
MARRPRNGGDSDLPAADVQPAVPVVELVVIRGGHRHKGVTYAADTPYSATPAEAELLRRYGALVTG